VNQIIRQIETDELCTEPDLPAIGFLCGDDGTLNAGSVSLASRAAP
jgi:hypothetical protein